MKPVRIGWQPTTTVEAQIAHTLAKTDILERNGLKGELTMFSYGPAVNEALISGAIDVGFIGDMPSISLLATGAPITIVARQSVFRGSILASTKTDIKTVADLKGKKIYGPYGSSIYRSALNMIKDAGLQPGRDVEVVNMGFADLSDALKAGRIDALFVWDPWIELFVTEGLARELKADTSLTMVVAMRDAFAKSSPDAVERFLKAHKEASLFAAANRTLANEWFRQPEAARRLAPQLIDVATAYDPAWKAEKLADIRLAFSPAEFERYKDVARFAQELKITTTLSPVEAKTDLTSARRLDAAGWAFDPKSVKVKP
ncbi:MAG: ABC transporter substrate-binding protein [Proteobacteria bacterium]|nr:ABC transporter substrate-binding protein [Pseudomonadota bacterium]